MDTSIFEQIGEHSSKIYFIFDPSTERFSYMNRAAGQLFGDKLESVLQEPANLLQNVHPEDKAPLLNNVDQLLQGKSASYNFRLKLPEQPEKRISVEAFPIYDKTGIQMVVAGNAEDVTDQVEYEAYLMEFGRKKNSAMEILAHDLRGPIALIQSISDALQADHQHQDYSEFANYTGFIKRACETCVGLITSILNEEHLKSPTVAVKKIRVDLGEKVKEVVATYAVNKSITQTFSVNAPAKVFAYVDVVKIDQVINNFISNSIKFTEPDGHISFDIKQEQGSALVRVTDNGIGIPQELLPFLFEKYTIAARPGLHGEKSNGIGLSIVKELIELQGGEVWCESKEGKGTTFFMRLTSEAD